ncbi:TetR/AcrR family transcriptional regulator [Thiomicrorhabdus sp. ZW0627]|uniref:TetR/AcrR family transcriptional regulator n=1 Tax=Thiomicrorhabdus sp. ZW0627 TaxID=3039774 RepID=UPI002436B92E|nr:TetR/AcrR family transcriptional regulator [Thiomicrorhabdus sp. ZW0627]MDG6774117.1 TetR/AcrR family transcriptional regulator [Thiomicrorhabdus sp. ZW0627]
MSQTASNKTATAPATTKRGLARQQKILEVAETVFLAQGYEGSSVNEIVRLSGGSLGTLYRIFGNKLGLFEAVFKKKSKEIFTQFDDETFWTDDIAESLFQFGRTLQNVALSSDGLAIYRLVITENNLDQGEIQKIFYKYGPQTATTMLENYLKKQMASGRIELMDCKLAATQFLEMIKGPFILRSLFCEEVPEEEIILALNQAIKIFLKGCSVEK